MVKIHYLKSMKYFMGLSVVIVVIGMAMAISSIDKSELQFITAKISILINSIKPVLGGQENNSKGNNLVPLIY